jgi:3-hydroxyacyl-[acyl-carrier protein] dehydratase/trans-2-decenoyl-[acyl-carrier protein] isomerase
VQPGALGVDAVWQLLGLYCAVRGARGTGRALGCKEVEFLGQIRPHDKVVRYELDIKRYVEMQDGDVGLVIGSAQVLVDGKLIYKVDQAKVGMFAGIKYRDYPFGGENSVGGPREHG